MMLGKNQLVNMSLPVLSSVDYGQMSPMRILHARLTARRWCANKSQSAVIKKQLTILKQNRLAEAEAERQAESIRLAEAQPSIIRMGWLGYGHNYSSSVETELTDDEQKNIDRLLRKDNKMKKHKRQTVHESEYQNEMKIDSLD